MAAGWSVDEVTNFYSSYAKSYDDQIQTDSYPAPSVIGSWVLDHLSKLSQNSDPSEALRVLDLGCGTGQSSKLFFSQPLPNSIEVYGVDATPEMLEKAKQYPFHNLICQDIESRLPYQAQFDAIICVGVFDFIRHPEKLLISTAGLLKQNGKGCLGITLPESGDLNKFSEDEMMQLIHHAGFKLLKHDRFLGYEDSETKEVVQYHGLLLTL